MPDPTWWYQKTYGHPVCSLCTVGGIRPPFPCVSYEVTKRMYRLQRVYSVGLRRLPVEPIQSWLKRPRDAGPKRCHNSQTSRAQSPLNPFYTWCNMLLTGLHNSLVVSIPLLLPSNSSILSFFFPPPFPPLLLTCTRVRGNHNKIYQN